MLVYKLDRFSRDKYESTIHKHTLKENGVKLVSAMENIPDSPEGIILESILEGMNQYFSAELSQKVLRGMRESYLKGNYTGGILLYGFNVIDKKVIIDEQEGPIVKEIFAKFAQGYTVVEIANNLKSRGIRTKKGEYLIDKKIARRERDFLPVLACGARVFAVCGVDVSEDVRVDDDGADIFSLLLTEGSL